MLTKIIMPQGGQDLTTGKIVRWLRKKGEVVRNGEVICEVETEKAIFEVTAPQDGILIKILAQDGEEVEILSTIAYIGEQNEKIPEHNDPEAEIELTHSHQPKVSEQSLQSPHSGDIPGIKISPKARLLARQHHINIFNLKSDRPDGKITTQDVMHAVEKQNAEKRTVCLPDHARQVKPGRMRRATALRMSQSWSSAPHIFMTLAIDMTQALGFMRKTKDGKLSITGLVAKACSRAIQKYPDINASYIDEDTIFIWEDINIGLAVSTERGLVVAVLEDADTLSLLEATARIDKIVKKAREGKLLINKPSRFTISNMGMYNVDQFTAVLNPPEAAILAVSSILKKPVAAEDGQIVVRDMMNVTLSLDHRVGDGVLAAEFVNEIKRLLENPVELDQILGE